MFECLNELMGIFNKLKKIQPTKTKKSAAIKSEKIVKKTAVAPRKYKIEKKEFSEAWRILRHPQVTEKSTRLSAELNQYVFLVASAANKIEIEKAVQDLYGVKVNRVNVINIPKKERRVGKNIGFKPGYKKAIVTLAEGEKIEGGA